MKEKLKFLIALTVSIGLVCGTPVSADQPQAGFRGGAGQAADTNLDTLSTMPDGSAGAQHKLVGTNAAGTDYELKTLTSVANQTTVSVGVGTATVGTVQNIGTGSTPTFAGLNVSAPVVPTSAGGTTEGSAALPFSSVYVGGAATNNIRITGTATAARTFTLPNADSNPVQPDAGASNQFLTAISSAGVISKAQPSFSNISGTATIAQGGTNNGSLGVSAVGIYVGDGSKIVQVTGTASQQFRVNAGGTAIEAFTASAASSSFTIATKTTNFTASDGANYYYRMTTNDQTVTLPASPADGSVRKFKMVTAAKTATFAFNGAETINHADGTSDQSLTLTSTGGTIELIAVSGGWDET